MGRLRCTGQGTREARALRRAYAYGRRYIDNNIEIYIASLICNGNSFPAKQHRLTLNS